MIQTLKTYINQFVQLSAEEFSAFGSILYPKALNKKEHLIQINEVCKKVMFFEDGYFRFYHTDYNGNEITSDFYFAPGFITSYTSLITGNPSFVGVQAMENINALECSKENLYQLYERYPKIERLGRLIAESIAISSEKHLFLLLNQTAETRYKNLIEKHPQFIQQVPLQYIASYLGITKETLSRMRKSLY